MNGSKMERDLLGVMYGHGFERTRTPGSGTGDWAMPDVLAARQGVIMVSELKSGENPRNITEAEGAALKRVADAFWGAAVISVRYKGNRTFYLCPLDALSRTDAGNYSIPNSPERLPWSAALPYRVDDAGPRPVQDEGAAPTCDFAVDDPPPDLSAWLDALTAQQQGFHVRQGICDRERGATADDGAGSV